MNAEVSLLLVATFVVAVHLGVVAQQCEGGVSCSVAIQCLHGERRLKTKCPLSTGAQGICCSEQLKSEELSQAIADQCIPPQACPQNEVYRSTDGSCVNRRDPRLGMSNTAYTRLLPASYVEDDWARPIRQPQPRDISQIVFAEGDVPHPRLSLMTTHWGQLLAHDLTFSSPAQTQNGNAINCCERDGSASSLDVASEDQQQCGLRIGVRRNDPFYRNTIRCLNFVRAQISNNSHCYGYGADRSSAVARQINQATHYLDASMVYGSTDEAQNNLRTFRGGKLRVQRDTRRGVLPLGNDTDCAPNSGGCFVAGDPRSNHVPALTTLHTLLLREHNRLTDELAQRNPRWNDNTLFQEARSIVIAQVQHITYNEWLPGIIGPSAMEPINSYVRSLNGNQDPPSHRYNPAISSEFAAAAFRFGHSAVDGRMNLSQPTESLPLFEFFFRSGRLRENNFFDRVLRWLFETNMQQVDRYVITAFRGLLDNTITLEGTPFGGDLIATNIQRGRDFGLRRFIDYRFWLGMQPVNEFSDLEDVMTADNIRLLSRAYANPGDIDLYVGGLLENHATGAAVGPTFQAIIAEQFARTLMGDRFFYTNSKLLTQAQIREIRRTSLARLICDNSDNIRSVPRNAFRVADDNRNPMMSCGRIRAIDLDAWTEGL